MRRDQCKEEKKENRINKHLYPAKVFFPFFYMLPLRHFFHTHTHTLSLFIPLCLSINFTASLFPFANFCNIQWYTLLAVVGNMLCQLLDAYIFVHQLTITIIKNMMLSSHHNCCSLFWLFFFLDLFRTLIVRIFF